MHYAESVWAYEQLKIKFFFLERGKGCRECTMGFVVVKIRVSERNDKIQPKPVGGVKPRKSEIFILS